MGRYNNRRIALCYVRHNNTPNLPPHHWIQAVHRFIQNQKLRPDTGCQPECDLLLHPFGKAADIFLRVNRRKIFHQARKHFFIKRRVNPLVKTFHFHSISLHKIKNIIWNKRKASLYLRILIDFLARYFNRSGILPVNPGQMPKQCRLPRAIRPDQAIYSAPFHIHICAVKRAKAIKFFY